MMHTVPSAPSNVTLQQTGESLTSVVMSWERPEYPNGIIDGYLVWYAELPAGINQTQVYDNYTSIESECTSNINNYSLFTNKKIHSH